MALFLEVKNGSQATQKFSVQEGVRLGRGKVEIVLHDPKISSLHAQIEKDASGHLVLVDQESVNGLLINDERVPRVALLAGVEFRVGRTVLQVIDDDKMIAVPAGFNLNPKAEQRVAWKQTLIDQVPQLLAQNSEHMPTLFAFTPALSLHFIAGMQIDEIKILGYGPRQFGSSVLDIELKDNLAPGIAFEIVPEGSVARFVTNESRSVQLNGASVASAILRAGDVITVGDTQIEVSFLTDEN